MLRGYLFLSKLQQKVRRCKCEPCLEPGSSGSEGGAEVEWAVPPPGVWCPVAVCRRMRLDQAAAVALRLLLLLGLFAKGESGILG